MAKTRSQTSNITVKREEDRKDTQLLHSVNNIARNSKKITKRKMSRSKSSVVSTQEVKVEENTDVKPLLKSPQTLLQEQIKQIIHYVTNDRISLYEASKKVKLAYTTASYYYNIYKNDPQKKIPLPLQQPTGGLNGFNQEQITKLIKHIVDDGMSILEASALSNMTYISGSTYYRKYVADPNHNIPKPASTKSKQEQINRLIGYIVDDKMPLRAASKKANMSADTGRKYYHSFLKDPNHDIAVSNPQDSCDYRCTQDQINRLISYIIDDKMTLIAAAAKLNIHYATGQRYFLQYINDPNRCIPVPSIKGYFRNPTRTYTRTCTQDQIKKMIGYIVDDKMSIIEASAKVNTSINNCKKYYQRYLDDPNHAIPDPEENRGRTQPYTQDKINELIGYIDDDKMSIKAASKKANMSYESGKKHYRKHVKHQQSHAISTTNPPEEDIKKFINYITEGKMSVRAASEKANVNPEIGQKYYQQHLDDPNHDISAQTASHQPFTQEQIDTLINYIVDDKMSLWTASKKANMSISNASKYYRQYLNDPNNQAPAHIKCRLRITQKGVDDLIRYIVKDKLTVKEASKKANVSIRTGKKYLNRYLKNHH